MNINKNILSIISKYLKRNESISERRTLYHWYESINDESQLIHKDKLIEMHDTGKKRLFNEIGGTLSKKRVINTIWYRIAASIVLILAGYFAVTYFINENNLIAVNNQELEKIAPASGKAIMRLSTGEVMLLDTLGSDKSTELGGSIIHKGENGRLSYQAANNAESERTIGTLQTSRAAQYNIILSDGTRVWLNAKTKLSFPQKFGAGDRIVDLEGEAYFEVNKTLQKSKFIVKTQGQSIEVLGTKFNINSYNISDIKTTLSEGSVRVSPTNTRIGKIILSPNEQSILGRATMKKVNVDASRIIAWKDGYFSFDGNNTKEVIEEIGKWYGIPVEYRAAVKSIKYTGKISKNINLSRLVMLLSYQDINIKAYKDQNNKLKIIVN